MVKPRYFWLEGDAIAHITKDVRQEETEAGTDGDVHVGYCGKEQQFWFYQGQREPKRGHIKDVVNTGASICQKCYLESNKPK